MGYTEDYDVEWQYQQYLKRVKLSEKNMPEIQKQEMRRCFFGAWGQLLILQVEKLGKLPEPIAVGVLEHMLNQVKKFWGILPKEPKQN